MIWRLRSRSRTICLSLALACASLYLLLLLLSSRPLRLRPCRSPPPPQTRFLAGGNVSSAGVKGRHGTEPPEPAEAGLAKLEALFNHPLYSWPHPPTPEEDLLLRVRAKVTSSGRSSPMWSVIKKDECWEKLSPQRSPSKAPPCPSRGSDSLEDGDRDRDRDRDGDGDGDVPRSGSSSSRPPWLRFHLGISRRQLYSHPDPNTAPLLQQLATHRIVSAVQKSGGTQLKLVMSFPNSGQAIFKPMKQERDEETNYNLYYFSDFERHNAEIAAFHLDRILGYRRVPPVVGRLIDVIKEIKNVTTDRKLARTFFTSPVGSVCFYGQCSYYCSTEHAVCGRPTGLEASLAVMLPDVTLATRRSWKSPWRRSYSRSKLAKWETQPDYCTTVKQTAPYDEGTRLVDFMDMVVLDFLMSMFLWKERD